MKPFWRESPLSEQDNQLIGAVGEAHYRSAFRQNPSTVALQCAAQGSGDLLRSLAAALSTFGQRHGPIEETYEMIAKAEVPAEFFVGNYLERKQHVPGWGSSFTKGEMDPDWKPVYACLENSFPNIEKRITAFTNALHDEGVDIYPNPSALTAAAAIALDMPKRLSPYLLVMGRLAAWAEIFLNETKGT